VRLKRATARTATPNLDDRCRGRPGVGFASAPVVDSEVEFLICDRAMAAQSRIALVAVFAVVCVSACSGGGRLDAGPMESVLDESLREVLIDQALTGDPATPRQQLQRTPAEDPKIKLGQLLFFSHSLSGDLTVSCATCHHPDFGGADSLSLGLGVAAMDAAAVGPERQLNPAKDLDPAADGGPNMHRNSQTVFNAALFDRSMTFDGRVFVLDEEVKPGGMGQTIRTPESGNLYDSSAADGLLEVVSKFPLTNHNEMRAYLFSAESQEQYREHLVARLRGDRDDGYLSPGGPANWLALFRQAFAQPDASAEEIMTLVNVQRALGAFMKSLIFIESPWKRYVEGDEAAISKSAKRGALLFYRLNAEGGLGCASCHGGDFFTNENFYNVGFPQIGRGFMRPEKDDIGRWNVTRREEDKYAFRVPSLLNIGMTMPYGHAGSFDRLADAMRYHSNPREAINRFDFSLSELAQFQAGMSYPYAESHTQTAIDATSFSLAEPLLPGRDLTDEEVADLTAFLLTLTDDCVKDPVCRNQWIPTLAEDPDGNLLVRDVNPAAEPDVPPEPTPNEDDPPAAPTDYPKTKELTFNAPALTTFAELGACEALPYGLADNTGLPVFVPRHDVPFGLYDQQGQPVHPHGFSAETWDVSNESTSGQPTMIAGGVSATYLDDDCWLDLAYAGGDRSGMVFYKNRGGQMGFDAIDLLEDDPGGSFTGVGSVDLNGDYRRELLFGNLEQKKLPIYSSGEGGGYYRVATLSISRHTYGMSFADTNHDGYPDVYLAHWFPDNVLTAPAFWKNNAGGELEHYDEESGLSNDDLSQDWNFSPQFADMNADGEIDLMLASDFGTSVAMQGIGNGIFTNVTDRRVITDENGMGSALGDYDNDGDLDWFVTSILDPDGEAEGNWGVTGNRLYRNDSGQEQQIQLKNVTEAAGVADGNWGWGACFADFDNDGYLDIFHVNGFGNIPSDVVVTFEDEARRRYYRSIAAEYFDSLPRLFINQGNGTFKDQAVEWGLLPSDGRGITCLDYDRDGDMDVALLDHSNGLQFFESQVGHESGRRFLSVRLVGAAPNTEALGATVRVIADVGGDFGVQTQTRVSMANTNFNGQNPPDLHFGMGTAEQADLTIIWAEDGGTWQCDGVDTNQFLIFDQRSPGAYPGCQVQ
jgi:cytochrome c peroxidase